MQKLYVKVHTGNHVHIYIVQLDSHVVFLPALYPEDVSLSFFSIYLYFALIGIDSDLLLF